MTIQQIRAKIRLWWHFRNRKCYVCLKNGNNRSGNEELKTWTLLFGHAPNTQSKFQTICVI